MPNNIPELWWIDYWCVQINKSAVLDKSTPQHSVLVDVEGLVSFDELLMRWSTSLTDPQQGLKYVTARFSTFGCFVFYKCRLVAVRLLSLVPLFRKRVDQMLADFTFAKSNEANV